jgi:phage tail sheath gpL-like
MERIRYEQRMAAIKRFTGTAAAKTNEGYKPGLRITTEDDVRAMLLSLYRNTLMRDLGWVQEYDYYKDNLVVEQDPQNPSRFNYVDTPVLLSPFYILAGRAQFRKAV